jgi:chemotaxis protein MotA
MDKISVAGLFLGLAVIIAGHLLEGGNVSSLAQPTAFLIVIGGTLGAVMLQSPLAVFKRGLRMLKWVFLPPPANHQKLIADIVRWSNIARKDGLLALEAQIRAQRDPFVAKGLQLLVDGTELGRMREILEVDIGGQEASLKAAAKIWESAGGYAPTIGILGAVMGLIHVMENLSDPSRLGGGIAVAFVATIYGVGSANLIFLPVARKLLTNISRVIMLREMLLDGLLSIGNGDNPRIIEGRLQGYFADGSL